MLPLFVFGSMEKAQTAMLTWRYLQERKRLWAAPETVRAARRQLRVVFCRKIMMKIKDMVSSQKENRR